MNEVLQQIPWWAWYLFGIFNVLICYPIYRYGMAVQHWLDQHKPSPRRTTGV